MHGRIQSMDQAGIDAAVRTFYGELFDEGARLTTRSAQGRLEFERTQAVIRAATPPPARVLDVGGATGVHAAALARDGYDVLLLDPVEQQVAAAAAHGTFAAMIGDARHLDLPDDSFDVVLMAGPLYHLAERDDRLQALREARRVCRPGGFVHAAAIPRLAALMVAAVHLGTSDVSGDAWVSLVRDGTPLAPARFPSGHFHTSQELHDEMTASGFHDVAVIGLEGPAGFALETVEHVSEADSLAATRLAQTFEGSPDVRELSNHLLATGRA